MAKTKLPKITDETIANTIEAALFLLPDGNEKRAALSWFEKTKTETINAQQLFRIIGRASFNTGVRVNCAGKAFDTALASAQGLTPQALEYALTEGFKKTKNKEFVNPFEVIGMIEDAQSKMAERLSAKTSTPYIVNMMKMGDKLVPVWNDSVIGNR